MAMKGLLRIGRILAAAVSALAACSVSSSGGGNGNGGQGFSGDLPAGPSCSTACNACAQNSCGSTAACLHGDCVDFLNCFCACSPGNSDCQFPCSGFKSPDNHCTDCVASANACLKQKCASDCPDLDPPLSTGTLDGGDVQGETGAVTREAGPVVDYCAQLSACCPVVTPSINQLSCTNTVAQADPIECQSTLLSYQGDGTCP
jgi:hypothetical protein